jgi:hypothetical protein
VCEVYHYTLQVAAQVVAESTQSPHTVTTDPFTVGGASPGENEWNSGLGEKTNCVVQSNLVCYLLSIFKQFYNEV